MYRHRETLRNWLFRTIEFDTTEQRHNSYTLQLKNLPKLWKPKTVSPLDLTHSDDEEINSGDDDVTCKSAGEGKKELHPKHQASKNNSPRKSLSNTGTGL